MSSYIEMKKIPCTSPNTKYITIFDKSNTSYALYLDYVVLSPLINSFISLVEINAPVVATFITVKAKYVIERVL